MPSALKPLSFGEILDGAFTLYRRGFGAFVPTVLVVGAVPELLYLLLRPPVATTWPVVDPLSVLWALRSGGAIPLIVWFLAHAVTWIALTQQVSRLYEDEAASVDDGLAAAREGTAPLLGAWLIAGVAYGLPLLLCQVMTMRIGLLSASLAPALSNALFWLPVLVFLGLQVAARTLTFAIAPAVVLEGAGPARAVARSFRLADAALGRTAGVILVTTVLAALINVGLTVLIGASGVRSSAGVLLALSALNLAVKAFVLPFAVAASVLMYYDVRVRTEGLDMDLEPEPEPEGPVVAEG